MKAAEEGVSPNRLVSAKLSSGAQDIMIFKVSDMGFDMNTSYSKSSLKYLSKSSSYGRART